MGSFRAVITRAHLIPAVERIVISEVLRRHIPPCAKLQSPKITLALGGGMGYTFNCLARKKGEITDYSGECGCACRGHCFEKMLGKSSS